MTGKLSCENEKRVRRVWLVQFMDALNARGAVGMEFSWVFGAVETGIADSGEGAPQRDDITGLVVKQA